MLPADRPADATASRADQRLLDAAFRNLHGARLHAFALLLTLGDRRRAALLAADAIAAAGDHLGELRHPERAAAWLRARVTDDAGSNVHRLDAEERLATLAELNVGAAALAGLSALSRLERAGLIGSSIEGLDQRDVATIVGRDGRRLDALLRRARRRYLDGAAASPEALDGPPGPIGQRIVASAARTMA
jgi:DNA-directed RNA polymerase specialized sigma24 family protein